MSAPAPATVNESPAPLADPAAPTAPMSVVAQPDGSACAKAEPLASAASTQNTTLRRMAVLITTVPLIVGDVEVYGDAEPISTSSAFGRLVLYRHATIERFAESAQQAAGTQAVGQWAGPEGGAFVGRW